MNKMIQYRQNIHFCQDWKMQICRKLSFTIYRNKPLDFISKNSSLKGPWKSKTFIQVNLENIILTVRKNSKN